jgi:hypothetical protein
MAVVTDFADLWSCCGSRAGREREMKLSNLAPSRCAVVARPPVAVLVPSVNGAISRPCNISHPKRRSLGRGQAHSIMRCGPTAGCALRIRDGFNRHSGGCRANAKPSQKRATGYLLSHTSRLAHISGALNAS